LEVEEGGRWIDDGEVIRTRAAVEGRQGCDGEHVDLMIRVVSACKSDVDGWIFYYNNASYLPIPP
jgi:hypothetical protein